MNTHLDGGKIVMKKITTTAPATCNISFNEVLDALRFIVCEGQDYEFCERHAEILEICSRSIRERLLRPGLKEGRGT